MEIASLGFRTDLMVLGLGGSEIERHARHVVVRTPANPTFWWGNFVLFPDAVERAELAGRLELFAHAFPDAEHVAWGIDSTDGTAGDEEALVEAGFEVGRDTVLTATELRAPVRAVDANLRPLRGDADWHQALDLHVACSDPADEAVTEEFLDGQVSAARTLTELGHATWFGARRNTRIGDDVIWRLGGGVHTIVGVDVHATKRLGAFIAFRADADALVSLGAPIVPFGTVTGVVGLSFH